MSVKAKEKYEATIASAAMTVNDKGTLGLGINYDTSDGQIAKTWYVTVNTVDRFKEMVNQCFGITAEQLQDEKFLMEGIGKLLKGQPCSITTKEAEDANGNVRTDKQNNPYPEVQWMNPSRVGRRADADGIRKAVGLFGGSVSTQASTDPGDSWPTDNDAPAF